MNASFISKDGHSLALSFNASGQSVRLNFRNVYRLFFYKQHPFTTTVFQNEYGVEIGRLNYTEVHLGKITINNLPYLFRFTGEDPCVLIYPPGKEESHLCFEVNDDLLIDTNANSNHQEFINGLLFSFAWIYNNFYGNEMKTYK